MTGILLGTEDFEVEKLITLITSSGIADNKNNEIWLGFLRNLEVILNFIESALVVKKSFNKLATVSCLVTRVVDFQSNYITNTRFY